MAKKPGRPRSPERIAKDKAKAMRAELKALKEGGAVRAAEVRTPSREDVRAVGPRGEARVRVRKGSGTDRLHIPRELIPDGTDLQWVTNTVLGSPATQQRQAFEINGWRPVTPDMFGGRFDGMFMPRGYKGEIEVEGLVLMERPMELTLEARREERESAQMQTINQERKIQSGQLDGVTLDTQHPSAKANTRLTRTLESGISVPD